METPMKIVLKWNDKNIVPSNSTEKSAELKFRTYNIGVFLLHHHNLHDWKLVGRTLEDRVFGSCDFNTKTILINKKVFYILNFDMLKDIILHEIAHALAGAEHAHDETWKAKALEIGSLGRIEYIVKKLIKVDDDKFWIVFLDFPIL
jgi:predicted metal-dependent peptidase